MDGAMNQDTRLRVCEPDVAAKVIDGEAVVINLASGMYYNLNGTGSIVWELIGENCSLAEAADAVAKRFKVPFETAVADISSFLDDLLKERLVGMSDAGAAKSGVLANEPASAGEYSPPALTKFDDMADLFAADPPLPELPAMSKSEQT